MPAHQEAVTSAEQVLTVAEREGVRALAEDIIDVQTREIATIEGWLDQWYPQVSQDIDYQPMMRNFEGLAPAQAERAFIEDMIRHHEMAVADAQQLLAQDLAEHEEVAAMAQDIVSTQTREINELHAMLRDWYGATPGSSMGMMQQGMMGERQGMHEMMEDMSGIHGMMQQCMNMMHRMMAGGAGTAFGPEGVEALARAYLVGQQSDAEIVRVEAPRSVYRVTYQDGDAERVLLIDADTGDVVPENATE